MKTPDPLPPNNSQHSEGANTRASEWILQESGLGKTADSAISPCAKCCSNQTRARLIATRSRETKNLNLIEIARAAQKKPGAPARTHRLLSGPVCYLPPHVSQRFRHRVDHQR